MGDYSPPGAHCPNIVLDYIGDQDAHFAQRIAEPEAGSYKTVCARQELDRMGGPGVYSGHVACRQTCYFARMVPEEYQRKPAE
jgi:hypothetical protein